MKKIFGVLAITLVIASCSKESEKVRSNDTVEVVVKDTVEVVKDTVITSDTLK